MSRGTYVALVAALISIILLVLILFIIRRWFRSEIQTPSSMVVDSENLETGRFRSLDQESTKRRANFHVFRRGVTSKPLFIWADNPSLVNEAAEQGWLSFAFTNYASYTASPSLRSARTLLAICSAGDKVNEMGVEIDWEACQGSNDFLQKIRLNSGLKKINTSSYANSVIKTALPFPGPPFGNSAFPQEAYFEIKIVFVNEGHDRKVLDEEGEKIVLIGDDSESVVSVTSSSNGHGNVKNEDRRLGYKEGKGEAATLLSLGLSVGGSLPLKLPGSYPGSIGFNSNGSVYLDGIKLIFESETREWGRNEKVIGCGYNPSKKKVFLTVDAEVVHEINCKSEEFETPLYPTLAANCDITVLVNFGQTEFKYAPANMQRISNPCFTSPLANSPLLSCDDKELFSIGRINSQWRNRSTTRGQYMYGSSTNRGTSDFDEISEGDLFEIALNSSGRSPHPDSVARG